MGENLCSEWGPHSHESPTRSLFLGDVNVFMIQGYGRVAAVPPIVPYLVFTTRASDSAHIADKNTLGKCFWCSAQLSVSISVLI